MNYRNDKYGNPLSVLGLGCMRFPILNGQTDLALAKGLETFGIAGAIAIGVFLGSSLMRLIFDLYHHYRRA